MYKEGDVYIQYFSRKWNYEQRAEYVIIRKILDDITFYTFGMCHKKDGIAYELIWKTDFYEKDLILDPEYILLDSDYNIPESMRAKYLLLGAGDVPEIKKYIIDARDSKFDPENCISTKEFIRLKDEDFQKWLIFIKSNEDDYFDYGCYRMK